MKKKYIIELDEINCCGVCPLNIISVVSGSNKCSVTRREINDMNTIELCCPLIELNPNKLDWKLLDVTGLYSALNGKYTISPSRIYEKQPIFYSCFFLGIHLENRDTINDAMQFCQDHCDNLFFEMIGVKK